MAAVGQTREGELRTDQLEIGKVYRMEQYVRPNPGAQHQLMDQSLVRFKKRWGDRDIFMQFTIVAPGTDTFRSGLNITIPFDTNPTHNYYYRFFQTAQDRIVKPFEQETLKQVLANIQRKGADPLYPNATHGIDPAAAHGLSDGWFAPNVKPPKKSGGRKYKTRQTKLRRKNRTKKNRRRTHK